MERDLNDVRIFTKVVEARSFTAAATALGLPNSTVSRRVSRLEKALGVRLLHRTTRKLSLTDAGHVYYERSVRFFSELEDAENELAQSRSTPRGRIRVIAPVEHTISVLLVTEFLGRYPEVRVDMEFSSRDLNIIHEGFDVAIHVGVITNMSVVAHKLIDSPFRIVASPSYLKERGCPTSIASLTDHDCLILGPSSSNAAWTLPDGGRCETRIPVRGRLAANHLAAVRAAACAGLGVALLPLVTCRSDIEAGVLRVVLPGVAPPPVPVHVIYPSGGVLAPSVRAFVDFVRERFAVIAGDISGAVKRSGKRRRPQTRSY